jgi:hypothetical protein
MPSQSHSFSIWSSEQYLVRSLVHVFMCIPKLVHMYT